MVPCSKTDGRLLLLPFHIGPAATNPLCETKFDLLSQLPYFIVDAVYDLLLLLLLLYVYRHLLVST